MSRRRKAKRGKERGKERSGEHLLRFSLPEREKERRKGTGRKKHHWRTLRNEVMTPETYLRGRFRFLLNPTKIPDEMHSILQNPDLYVDWESVSRLESMYPEEDEETCPICLATLDAPRITKCGHIFCMTCLYRMYLEVADDTTSLISEDKNAPPGMGIVSKSPMKQSFPCPVCTKPLRIKDIRGVFISRTRIPELGKSHEFVLLRRDSKFACPNSCSSSSTSSNVKFQQIGVMSNPKDMLNCLEQDTNDIQRVLKSLDAKIDSKWTHVAKRCLSDIDSERHVWSSMMCPCEKEEEEEKKKGKRMEKDNTHFTYYYQSKTGLHIYLSDLNVKYLRKEFESYVLSSDVLDFYPHHCFQHRYEKFPSYLNAKVISVNQIAIDPEMRKRNRSLRHLSLGAVICCCT